MQAVFMAGGLGTRLRPITLDTPKPMIRVNGRPFLEHQISFLKKQGIKEFLLCVGYLHEKVVEHFGDGRGLGVGIQYSVEDKPLGTGGALKNAENKIEQVFMVLNADTYLPIDYPKLVGFYRKKKKKAVMVLYDNHEKLMVNNARLGGDGLVQAYNKESSEGMTHVDAGTYLFNKRVLSLIPAGREVSLETEVLPKLIEGKELAGYVTGQRFYDMGTPERLRETEEVLR